MQDIGTLGGDFSEGHGINNSGQVVGWSWTAGNAVTDAFLYSNGQMTDLNTLIDPSSGWTLIDGFGINDLGQITGDGIINGQQHAFLMTPPGSLTVTISPAGAVGAGAMWNVDGGRWQASGAVVPNLSVGSHTVAFSGVQGWTTPPSQTVTIANGQTASAVGTYTPFFAAIFTASTTSGKAPLKVHFTNCSAGSFTKWLWHFGDGETSKIWNPTHTYNKAGVFTVTLAMTGAKGTCTCDQPGLITVYAAPKANFSAVPRAGDAPLTVNFTNESSGIVTNWLWNFGDGTTSTDANPTHTYNSPRTYEAKLTVYGPGGAGSKTVSIIVKK
jgi:probable HAF family extracellular repeat protein